MRSEEEHLLYWDKYGHDLGLKVIKRREIWRLLLSLLFIGFTCFGIIIVVKSYLTNRLDFLRYLLGLCIFIFCIVCFILGGLIEAITYKITSDGFKIYSNGISIPIEKKKYFSFYIRDQYIPFEDTIAFMIKKRDPHSYFGKSITQSISLNKTKFTTTDIFNENFLWVVGLKLKSTNEIRIISEFISNRKKFEKILVIALLKHFKNE